MDRRGKRGNKKTKIAGLKFYEAASGGITKDEKLGDSGLTSQALRPAAFSVGVGTRDVGLRASHAGPKGTAQRAVLSLGHDFVLATMLSPRRQCLQAPSERLHTAPSREG